MMKSLPFYLLIVFSHFPVYSQKSGNWIMYFGQVRFLEKWSLHNELQFRDYGFFTEAEQILLRGGLNYHVSKESVFTGGYARISNYAFDYDRVQVPVSAENRTWQQLLLKNNMGRWYFEHRYRLEQRWIKSKNNLVYRDRIRYLVRISVPLNKDVIEKKSIFLSFYDELFLHLSPAPFDRNRLYGALGYQFLPNANLQVGYLAQTVNNTTKSYLQAALFYNLDARKKE